MHKQKKELLNVTLFFRRGSGIRTHDPLLPKRRDNKGYSATYQSIIMMRANHFKDSSKSAILMTLFLPFLVHNLREQFLAFELCFLAGLSGVVAGVMRLFCLFLPYIIITVPLKSKRVL